MHVFERPALEKPAALLVAADPGTAPDPATTAASTSTAARLAECDLSQYWRALPIPRSVLLDALMFFIEHVALFAFGMGLVAVRPC